MIFYFIAQRPHTHREGDRRPLYLLLEEAQEALEFINGILPLYNWQISRPKPSTSTLPRRPPAYAY